MHLDTSSSNLVSNYGTEGINVNGVLYTRHLVVSPSTIREGWTGGSVKALTIADFEDIVEDGPELIILGTGRKHQFVHPKLYADLSARACALEVMTTSAACRTYNVLVSEFRDVIAVLMQIES